MRNQLTTCEICGGELAASAKKCPHCGAKRKKPFFKKWQFWVIVIFVVGVIGSVGEKPETADEQPAQRTENQGEKRDSEEKISLPIVEEDTPF